MTVLLCVLVVVCLCGNLLDPPARPRSPECGCAAEPAGRDWADRLR